MSQGNNEPRRHPSLHRNSRHQLPNAATATTSSPTIHGPIEQRTIEQRRSPMQSHHQGHQLHGTFVNPMSHNSLAPAQYVAGPSHVVAPLYQTMTNTANPSQPSHPSPHHQSQLSHPSQHPSHPSHPSHLSHGSHINPGHHGGAIHAGLKRPRGPENIDMSVLDDLDEDELDDMATTTTTQTQTQGQAQTQNQMGLMTAGGPSLMQQSAPATHHHRLPPTLTGMHAKHRRRSADNSREGAPSVVGQEGMPPAALKPRGPKLKFTPEDDNLLLQLKENKNLSWKQIADFFPGRTSGTLQVRYCTKLKAKPTQWTPELDKKLQDTARDYDNDKWRHISNKMAAGFTPDVCRERMNQLQVDNQSLQ